MNHRPARSAIRRFLAGIATFLLSPLLTGCYYGQAVRGQFEIERKSRPVERVLARADTSEDLRERLLASRGMLGFAKQELRLPAAGAYTRYADLGRPFVVWNVFAAPEFSLEPKRWHYPLVGRLAYRGFFKESSARALAERLAAEGYDVFVGGVRAYSTLGWFDDPLLNTFIHQSDTRVAALLFHELAHRRVFYKGDTAASEAFAVAVEREGTRRWLRASGDVGLLGKYEKALERSHQLQAAAARTRSELAGLYRDARQQTGEPEDWSEELKTRVRESKDALLDQLQRERESIGGSAAGNRIPATARINNAQLAAAATYHELVPGFDALLARHDGDLDAFYEAADRLRGLSRQERRALLIAGERENEPAN